MNVKSNPLFDIGFLYQLTLSNEREVFARITALTWKEEPIEFIEGKTTGGSVNVDGKSAVRRTCNVTMVAQDVDINEFYWGLKNKFKLEIGLKNNINPNYPDIIWFKQGTYIITSFNTTQNTNSYNISISGKDKMCLLNGDISGAMQHITDFGIEEYHDKVADTVTYTSIPIKTIIRESVQNFGNELPHNIIINDIEDAGLELLEYRGDTPLYLFREVNSDQFLNMAINPKQKCYIDDEATTISDERILYDNLVDLEGDREATIVTFTPGGKGYKIAKFEYGSIPGYRLTDLVFAGDLIANVGETLTSVLDKIKNMLGEFEYFYNLDGKFVFQKKKNYVTSPWNSAETDDGVIVDALINNSSPTFNFTNGHLIASYQNTPNLLNLRNDFSVWGTRKFNGVELPIHMRYAIDTRPTLYTTLDGVTYDIDHYDWRELIYQMALDYRRHYHDDDFLFNIAQKNPHFPYGRTGYEQYYIDMEGFWRELYDPNPQTLFEPVTYDIADSIERLYIQHPYRRVTDKDLEKVNLRKLFILDRGSIYPYLGSKYCKLDKNTYYFFITEDNVMNYGTRNEEVLNGVSLDNIYLKKRHPFYSQAVGDYVPFTVPIILENEETIQGYEDFYVYKYPLGTSDLTNDDYTRFVDIEFPKMLAENKDKLFIQDSGYMAFSELEPEIQQLYLKNNIYQEYVESNKVDNFNQFSPEIIKEQIHYSLGYYDYWHEEEKVGDFWSKQIAENPEALPFWFDFLDAYNSDVSKYAVPIVGSRTKSINDSAVKSIYYKEIPTTIFKTTEEIKEDAYEHKTGYTYIQLQDTMRNLFTISSKGKSAKEKVDELLYAHSYCVESINISSVPVYHLEPNNRIFVKDDNSKIDGEYIVDRITIPLTYNGMMTITATKAVSSIVY